MQLHTVGKVYNPGKIAYVHCVANEDLTNIDIKNRCFLMLIITEGILEFKIRGKGIIAAAPCFVCFSEEDNPEIISKRRLRYFGVYFHPQFLNINMSFSLIHSSFYGDIAHAHDMFLLRPFLDNIYVVPILGSYVERLTTLFCHMKEELNNQTDWYWSCKVCSYFMEMMICLERLYGLIGRGQDLALDDNMIRISDEKLRKAVLFIENNYSFDIGIERIASEADTNHTTLNHLFSSQLCVTPIQYLREFRIKVAKKHLAFTELSVKNIAIRCGFKTPQHFSRVFKEQVGESPIEYRRKAVRERISVI